jgi:hypothetical protein
MSLYEPPHYLNDVGRHYYQKMVERAKGLKSCDVYGLGLLAYLMQRIVGGHGSPDDPHVRALIDEFFPPPRKKRETKKEPADV